MILIDLGTGQELEAEIELLKEEDLEFIENSQQFIFDWRKVFNKNTDVFKIYLRDLEKNTLRKNTNLRRKK